VDRQEEVAAGVQPHGNGIFLVAVKNSFSDSGSGNEPGSGSTVTRHYVTCESLKLDRREVLVQYLSMDGDYLTYRITLR
jgi:hypothetical protein